MGMRRPFLAALALSMLPALAFADTGGPDRDWYRNLETWEAMRRDGRLQQLIDEGQANKQAFERLKAGERALPRPEFTRQPASRSRRAR